MILGACHLIDCFFFFFFFYGGIYSDFAFPLADEATRGCKNKISTETP